MYFRQMQEFFCVNGEKAAEKRRAEEGEEGVWGEVVEDGEALTGQIWRILPQVSGGAKKERQK